MLFRSRRRTRRRWNDSDEEWTANNVGGPFLVGVSAVLGLPDKDEPAEAIVVGPHRDEDHDLKQRQHHQKKRDATENLHGRQTNRIFDPFECGKSLLIQRLISCPTSAFDTGVRVGRDCRIA